MQDLENDLYFRFIFTSDEPESLTAMLNELPFNGFEIGHKNEVIGYINSKVVEDSFYARLEELNVINPFTYIKKEVAPQNWNAAWEAGFEPVIVDNLCAVRADFHLPITDVQHEIIITPQMSFGTGHHETTYSMIKLMCDMDFIGKKVLDFGCGTGVLAILSAKLGANDILGVDIDNNAYINSMHNCAQNDADFIKIKKGDLTHTDDQYDVILANINRQIILDTLPSLSSKLSLGKQLLISGILSTDMNLIDQHLKKASFKVIHTHQRKDWMCILAHKE